MSQVETIAPASTSDAPNNEQEMSRRSSCPYAEALLANGSSSSVVQDGKATGGGHLVGGTTDAPNGDVSSSSASSLLSSLSGTAAVRACPAFSSGSCPFKDAQSAEQVQETLLKVPPSHFTANAEFFHVIQGLHKVKDSSSHGPTSDFTIPGGCPVQRVLKEQKSFTEAMEEFSLSSIMASLAKELESAHDQGERERQEDAARAMIAQVAMTTTLDGAPALESMSVNGDERDDTESVKTSASVEGATAAPTLSTALKKGTAVSHQAAEDVHFVANFIRGRIDRDLYKQLVAMLYHVYVALEECLDEHGPTHFATCHFPHELERTTALQEDVEYWLGATGDGRSRSLPEMTPATRDYVERIRAVAARDPLLLLSHAYTRYLGDLSGGKILARVARRALGLDKGEGLAFYEFENIDSPKLFKDRYRSALDALPLTPRQIDDLVGEANVAFLLNMRLFEELDVQARIPGAKVRPLSEALSYATAAQRGQNASSSASSEKCPFINPSSNTSSGDAVASAPSSVKRCPWPFILMHDPATGMRDVKTWAVLGLVLCYMWSLWMKYYR